MNRSHLFVTSAAVFVGLTVFSVCASASSLAKPDLHLQAENYIRAHITELSPQQSVLGGTFYVTGIQWQNKVTALVTYEDGHIQRNGRTTLRTLNGKLVMTKIRLVPTARRNFPSDPNGNPLPQAKAGQACGGMLNIVCASGLTCVGEAPERDVTGVCTKVSSSSSSASKRPLGKEGDFCGGIAGFACEHGLTCALDGTYPDAGGTCRRK